MSGMAENAIGGPNPCRHKLREDFWTVAIPCISMLAEKLYHKKNKQKKQTNQKQIQIQIEK